MDKRVHPNLGSLFYFDNLIGTPNSVDDLILGLVDQLALAILLVVLP